MSTVFVAPNAQFTAADPDLNIFGGSGAERVRLSSTASNVSINPNVETVDFAAALSAFTFQVTGNVVIVRQAGVIVSSVVVQDDANGTRFRFSDGGADLRITGLNQVTLGGVAVSTANGGATIGSAQMGANFNPGDPSSLSPSPPPPPPGAGTPTVADNQTFTVAENSANGTPVGTVIATDPDTKAPDNTLGYSITAGNGSGAFSINAGSGAITVSDSSKLDFETTPSFSLTVKATDGTGLSDTALVTVNVGNLNEAPKVNDGQSFTIAENSANGTAVGVVVASDPDTTAPNKTLSYAITAGNGSGAFAINTGTGAITVADGSKLDFETTPSFTLTVRATDGGSGALNDDAQVTIKLTDVNETSPAPVAVDDTWIMSEGTTALIPFTWFIGNDTDPNGDPLSLKSAMPVGSNVASVTLVPSDVIAIVVTDDNAVPTETGRIDYVVSDGVNIDTGTVNLSIRGLFGGESGDTLDISGETYQFAWLDNVGFKNVIGGAGVDVLIGNNGDDTLSGNGGNDELIGGGGFDQLDGGNGNDVIRDAGNGPDSINVGAGNDIVFFAPASVGVLTVTISNFDADPAGGQDLIDLDVFFDDLGFSLEFRQFGAGITVVNGNQLFIDSDNNDATGANGFELLAATFTLSAGVLDASDFVVGTL